MAGGVSGVPWPKRAELDGTYYAAEGRAYPGDWGQATFDMEGSFGDC